MANGNGWVLKTVIGVPIGMLLTTLGFMGNGIIGNRNLNVSEHGIIIDKMVERDEKLMDGLHRFDVRQEVLIEKVDAALRHE